MKMLEQGINLSNKAKKENCLAKVGASMALGIKPVEPRLAKKLKNLKQFLRKKRQIDYYTSPSPLFSRNKLNRTRIDTQAKPPCVQWTVELKFFKHEVQSEEMSEISWAHQLPVAEVLLHDVSEETKLKTLLSTAFLIKRMSNLKDKSRQEVFNLWLTDPANKEDGNIYAWKQLKLAHKRVCKKVQQQPIVQSMIVAATTNEEQEEGELEEGECMPVDDEVDEANHQAARTD